jgi:trimeric autotransporter adhesin
MKKYLLNTYLSFAFVLFLHNSTHAQTWTNMGTGITSTNGVVEAVCVWNGNVYVAGQFTMAGSASVMNIAKWDGNAWSAIPGLGTTANHVYALCVYNGALYAGGTFTTPGNRVAKFDGTSWSPLTSGIGPNVVKALKSFNGSLFVGGNFSTAGGNACHHVALWNGTSWTIPSTQNNSDAYCFAIHNNELYLGGAIPSYIYKWVTSSSSWTAIANTFQSTGAYITAMASYNGSLYASGLQITTGSSINISKWNGSAWSGVGTGFPIGTMAYALTPLNGYLYAGGSFTNAGTSGAKYLAAWGSTSSTWYMGITPNNLDFHVLAFDTVSSPKTLYAGGYFSVPYKAIMKSVVLVDVPELTLPADAVTIYPIPAHSNLYINVDKELANPQVEIYNMAGEKIVDQISAKSQRTIDVQNYAAGIYFVKITADGRTLTKKIVIE